VPDAPVVRQQDVVPNAPPQGVQQRGAFDDWCRRRCTAADPNGRITYSNNPAPCNAKAAQAQERFPVTLYTFACGIVCDSAQDLLNKLGGPHTVVDVGSGDGADKLKRLIGGLDAPALQVGDYYAVGFIANKWQGLLNDAGYPKTPQPRTNPVGRVVSSDKSPPSNSRIGPTTQTQNDESQLRVQNQARDFLRNMPSFAARP
jgi:hypothetical protein